MVDVGEVAVWDGSRNERGEQDAGDWNKRCSRGMKMTGKGSRMEREKERERGDARID